MFRGIAVAKDTRQLILEKSRALFKQQGYSATGMRQIADACGIQIGNLSYHFSKKEDLFMHFYSELFSLVSSFLSEQLKRSLPPWDCYVAKEYCFLYKCAFDPRYRNAFLDAINIPTLRREYIRLHHERFLEIFRDVHLFDEQDIYTSSVIVSAAEFQMMETLSEEVNAANFERLFMPVVRIRMFLLGIPGAEQRSCLQDGMNAGREVISAFPAFMEL